MCAVFLCVAMHVGVVCFACFACCRYAVMCVLSVVVVCVAVFETVVLFHNVALCSVVCDM